LTTGIDAIELVEGFPTLDQHIAALTEFVKTPTPRATTGYGTLDELILGPAAGEIALILGRSYTGKSMFIHNMMLNQPQPPGYLIFSMEMPARALVTRLASAWMGTDHNQLLVDQQRGVMSEQVVQMGKELDHHVIVEDPMDLQEMSRYLFVYRQWYGHDPKAVIIDYLELIKTDPRQSGWERTENLARSMKVWAKEEHIPVWLVHQSNMRRQLWEKPNEESAKGAGYREADVVIGIHKPSRDPELSEGQRQQLLSRINVDVIKNRINGKDTWNSLPFELMPSLRMVEGKIQNDTIPF
jgi:replicative DNA helicase